MRNLVLLLAAAIVFSLSGFAQAGSSGQTSTDTTTTTKSTTHKHGKASAGESGGAAKSEAKQSQLTGCLAKDAAGSGFMLTNGKYKKGVEVKSAEDLSAHVGHEVKLMGNWEKPTAGAEGGAGAKGATMRTFNASSLKHISDTCTAGAAAGGKKGKKAAAEKAPGV